MRLALRGVLVAVVAAVVTQAGAAASTRTTPNSVVFWTPRDGLLGVGVCASDKYACGSGAVERTTDGGRTYRLVLRTRRPVEIVQTLGSRGALVVTYDKHVYRTLDRGRTWQPWHTRPGASFATPQIGLGFRTYTVGSRIRMTMLHTSDGGRTWQRLQAPCVSEFPDIDLVTPQLGWIVCGGEPGAGNEDKEVFRTHDGGRTWQLVASTTNMNHPRVRGGIGSYGYPAGIAFASNGFGLLWESRGTLYVTRDGGTRWQPKWRVARPDVDFGRGASAFADGTGFALLGYGAGRPTRLIETHDFGRTWHVVRRWGR